MAKETTVRARIEPELKLNVELVFRQIGLTTSEAITLFFKQVELNRGLPFPVGIPKDHDISSLFGMFPSNGTTVAIDEMDAENGYSKNDLN